MPEGLSDKGHDMDVKLDQDRASAPLLRDKVRDVPAHLWRIHGRDFDLADFVDQHPGGRVSIMLGRGVDCTNLFESYHVFKEPRKILARYAVDGTDEPVPEDPSEFHRDIRKMMRDYFKGGGTWAHKAKFSHLVVMAGVWFTFLYSWIGWYQGDWQWLFVLPVAAWLCMANMAHDGSHFAVSRFPWANDLSLVLASPLYYTQSSWYIQHVVSHHQETNHAGRDADIHHMPFSRWHPDVEHEGRFTGVGNLLWHTLAFTLSTFMMSVVHPFKFIFWPVMEKRVFGADRMSKVYFGNHKYTPVPRHDGSGPTELSVMRIGGALARNDFLAERVHLDMLLWFWSVGTVVVPFLRFEVPKALAFATVPFLVSSVIFMIVTQVSHVQAETQSERVAKTTDFFKRQAMTSLDYNGTWNLVRFLTGGLCTQSIHHVCPGINSSHYSDLYPRFIEICRKHDCEPAQVPSIFHALGKHLLHVYRLGANYELDMNM